MVGDLQTLRLMLGIDSDQLETSTLLLLLATERILVVESMDLILVAFLLRMRLRCMFLNSSDRQGSGNSKANRAMVFCRTRLRKINEQINPNNLSNRAM